MRKSEKLLPFREWFHAHSPIIVSITVTLIVAIVIVIPIITKMVSGSAIAIYLAIAGAVVSISSIILTIFRIASK